MRLIVFIHQDSSTNGQALKQTIDQNFKRVEIQFFHTFNSLKSRLKQIHDHHRDIFILLADSKRRLTKLMSLVDLMEDKRIVLILPDDSKEVTSMAHQFFPRYFTCVNKVYADLCAVITKMSNQ